MRPGARSDSLSMKRSLKMLSARTERAPESPSFSDIPAEAAAVRLGE